jgi:gas vesicle protein
MKFTKGVFLGAILGMSAAAMMNSKSKNMTHNNTTKTTADISTKDEEYIIEDTI